MLAVAHSPHREDEARALANRLGLECLDEWSLDDNSQYAQLLVLDSDGLGLFTTGKKRPGAVRVDFLAGAVNHRRLYGGGQGQQIVKACGISSGFKPYIADMTAGLGRDSFVLSSMGSKVDMVERNPVVAALLADGLARATHSDDEAVRMIISRMTLNQGESITWLERLEQAPDVVYLDPMFPHTDKSAQVKKEMLAFRSLVGADEDSELLLGAALSAARCRVVVKRPRKAPSIQGPKPSYALEGKSGRFDIYALQRLAPAS